ncbi:hypothetical protein CVT24_000509 [Panaeolus cyanescens]|uniref:C2 domain-containing protein n=1 Tax=Panaeolus cyanescens TaxID=181874 RepID=A0A409VCM3_9AGAR|nr:hypothetical protein CVT24_000509 [Panaeolus cyanescens]
MMPSLYRNSAYLSLPPTNSVPSTGAIGVLRVVIQTLDITQTYIVRNPNPFVQLGIRGSNEVQSTSWEKSTCSANWVKESFSILVYSLEDVLEFRVRDRHRLTKSTSIGVAVFPLAQLKTDAYVGVGQVAQVLDEGEDVGRILFDVLYYPVQENEKGDSSQFNSQRSGSISRILDPILTSSLTDSGLASIHIIEADNLQTDRSMHHRFCRLSVTLSLDWESRPLHATQTAHFSETPSWQSKCEFLCADRINTTIVVKVLVTELDNEPAILGHMSLPLDNLLETMQESGTWWPLTGCTSGRLLLFASWKSIRVESNNRNSIYML